MPVTARAPHPRVVRYPYPELGALPEPQRQPIASREVFLRGARNPERLMPLQELCVAGIDRRLGPECVTETPVASLYGEDVWDVASLYMDEPRLCISAKAMTSSRHANLNNRLKEMTGEAAALRAREPDAVLGYLCLIDASTPGRIGGQTSRHSDQSLAEAIGRRCGQVERFPHHFDAGCVLVYDPRTGKSRPMRAPGLYTFGQFLDQLVNRWRKVVEQRGGGNSD